MRERGDAMGMGSWSCISVQNEDMAWRRNNRSSARTITPQCLDGSLLHIRPWRLCRQAGTIHWCASFSAV